MSIEDIDYLYKNSIKESSIILVDSSNRNKDVYQSPNNYTITLNEPFKYVYGIEILDSSIPRTMYIIDSNNDTLYFYTTSEESITLDHRDYTLDDLISEINVKLKGIPELNAIQVYPLTIPSSDASKIFFSNTENLDFFYILAFKSNLSESIGLDENSLSDSTDYTKFTSSDNQYSNIATTSNITEYGTSNIVNRTFKSGIGKGDHGKYEINSSFSEKQNLQMSGLVNLLGDKYIKLRSNIIEQHLHNSISNSKNAIGLGLFKLGVSGYVDSRFDFVNVKYRDFHPIGKLSSIDFRFETLDDTLYDFKGVNHNFLLNIKFYTPIQERKAVDYILNPNYNPDLIEYKKLQYEKYNSDEDIEEVTNDFKNNFLKAEKKYEYSSDEDLEYLSDNSDDTDNSDDNESSSSNESIDGDNINLLENRTMFHPTNYQQI
tara:strand:+ start:3353 stop:4648 length:1296 start_codon:yes stop_codon:yes gene_type:complete